MTANNDPSDPYLGLLIVGLMFLIMGIVWIVIGQSALSWPFIPMGAILLLTWFGTRSRTSNDGGDDAGETVGDS